MPATHFIAQLAEPANRSLLGGILRGSKKRACAWIKQAIYLAAHIPLA